MSILESLSMALDSLIANKMRAALTMLGIIIGVAAVITMIGIGRGSQASIESQIQANGTNLLYVSPGATQQNGVRTAQGSAQTLTYDDAKALVDPDAAPAIVAVSPQVSSNGQVVYGSANVNARISGVTAAALEVNNMTLASGDFIDENQVTARSTVVVLGANAATNLFGAEDPVGQTVRINNIQFRVIGVLKAKGGTGFGSQDDQMYVPLTTAQSRLSRAGNFRGGDTVSQITVKIANETQNDAAIQQITNILLERHRVSEADFTIVSQNQLLDTISSTTQVFTIFLTAIAAISLLVGGIGIMNIMLVSVTERTREIGLRKAVGARKADVLMQFLVEASVMSVLGGVIGVGLAFGLSYFLAGAQFGTFSINPIIGMDSVIMATLFSIGVGLFFGAYPANRAASLNPIDALRYE